MTKEEIQKLAEKIVLGSATEEEIVQYNRVCESSETSVSDAIKISAAEKESLEKAMKQAIFNKAGIGKVYRMNWLRWTAVAASVILVIGLGIVFLTNKKTNEQTIAVQNNKHLDSILFVVRHEVNTTGKEKRLQLPDGSLVVLAHNSEITYREPFTDRRDITLTGKARFKVAKDKTRPFTVVSGAIATTALGTEFTVTAFENTSQIIVRLYEGKVVVKAVDKADKRMKNDVFLLPGQELVYGSTVIVRSFKLDNAAATEDKGQSRDNPSIPQGTDEGTWYMFNNQSLGQVFDQLAKMYQVKIIYDKKEVQNIYFTRKYNSLDSIENILKEIAILNDLTITKDRNTFFISR